jgi:hypothetical protein
VSWENCSSTDGDRCFALMSQARDVRVRFEPTSPTLDVVVGGSGSGQVTSDRAGIACPGDCTETYAAGLAVVLTATPASTSSFLGWTGCDVANGFECTVTINTRRAVSAEFNNLLPPPPPPPPPPGTSDVTVSIIHNGDAQMTILSAAAGSVATSCDMSDAEFCSADVPIGESVTIAVTYDPSAVEFSGWPTGARQCDSVNSSVAPGGRTDRCVFTATPEDRTFSVGFPAPSAGVHRLLVAMDPASRGIGRITSTPPIVDCVVELAIVQSTSGGNCAFDVSAGTEITVLATPEPGTTTTFIGWTGCDSTPTPQECRVTMSTARAITARFTVP